ncbi:homoserine dehydrogenase [Anaerolineae bacterium CFX7]|nr:homoserine dehydrogenase [Anaerolineae bacterium CFX7]
MQIRLAVIGLGNVGRRFLELVQRKHDLIKNRFDLDLIVTAAGDTTGGADYFKALDIPTILELKANGKGMAAYPTHGRGERNMLEMVRGAEADVLVENTLTNLKDGEPGLATMRAALSRKMHVVTANKGPLVLAYQELAALAKQNGVKLLHSAAVAGGLPVVNLGRRDLGASDITKFEGVVNGTTNHILQAMTEGESFDAALKHMQELGIAEADPTLDVDGWDAANKLVIVANACLHRPTKLSDVRVEGIRGVTPEHIAQAKANGQTIKLVARATRDLGTWKFTVRPERLDATHPLTLVPGGYMGVLYESDINGQIFARIKEENPYPTAAAVLRDVITLYQ